jgi:putative ABC transport system ATP-binding protein
MNNKDGSRMNMIIEVANVSKSFQLADQTVAVLKNINLEIQKGEFISIMGPSGSGKSTLLYLLGGLDRVSQGSICVNGVEIQRLNDEAESKMRRNEIGFVFQAYNLIDNLTLEENIMLPALLEGKNKKEVTHKAEELMARVGILQRRKHTPKELSGGEQQRTAIARALINDPLVLFADEPIGNLDSKSGKEVLELLRDINREKGITILMVTHSEESTRYGNRIIRLRDGEIVL